MHVRRLHRVLPLAIACGLLFAPGCGALGGPSGKPTPYAVPTATVVATPVSLTFSGRGNRVLQIPNLDQMGVSFHVEYRGDGPFVAELRTGDGARADTALQASLFTLASTQRGPYTADAKGDILIAGPFLIDVRCSGDWEISVRQ